MEVPRFNVKFGWDCGCEVEVDSWGEGLQEALSRAITSLKQELLSAPEWPVCSSGQLPHTITITTPSGFTHRGEPNGVDVPHPVDNAHLN